MSKIVILPQYAFSRRDFIRGIKDDILYPQVRQEPYLRDKISEILPHGDYWIGFLLHPDITARTYYNFLQGQKINLILEKQI